MGRPLRIVQTEYPYHIVTRTNNKEFRFLDKKKVIKLMAIYLNMLRKKYNVKIMHFVLMSTHYHFICWLTEENLPKAMQVFNGVVSKMFNKLSHTSGHLWHDRYKSTVIQTENYLINAIKYIYQNPVRGGMVNKATDYQDGGTIKFYAFGKPVEVCVEDNDIANILGNTEEEFRKNFILLVDEELDENEARLIKNGLQDQFFGSYEFTNMMKEKFTIPKNEVMN